MKNLTFLFSALLCCSICLSSCGDDDTVDPGITDPVLTIFPGQGIATLKMGDPGSKVKSELGEGYEPIINGGNSGFANYNYFNNSKGVDIVFGQHSSEDLDINTLLIKSFQLSDNFDGMTEEGIRLGSTEAEVIAAYGEPDEMDMWSNVYYIGLLISYDDEDKVRSIIILEI